MRTILKGQLYLWTILFTLVPTEIEREQNYNRFKHMLYINRFDWEIIDLIVRILLRTLKRWNSSCFMYLLFIIQFEVSTSFLIVRKGHYSRSQWPMVSHQVLLSGQQFVELAWILNMQLQTNKHGARTIQLCYSAYLYF